MTTAGLDRPPQITRLSQLMPPSTHYTQLTNQWDEPPVADFAFSAPFQCFTPDSALHLKRICYTHYHTHHEYSTARTSACLRGVPEIEQAIFSCKTKLEELASRLVGLPLQLHPMNYEWGHVNVQRQAQTNPVDNWHQDSMPFVLVTVLTNHQHDTGGTLVVKPPRCAGHDHPVKCKLQRPGESILMQGSQLWHLAEPSATGERLTLVTSFVPVSCLVYDASSIRIAVQYTPPVECIEQFLSHAMARFNQVPPNAGSAAVTREINKVIQAKHEIQWVLGYGNNGGTRDQVLGAAFERWEVVNGALLKWYEMRLQREKEIMGVGTSNSCKL